MKGFSIVYISIGQMIKLVEYSLTFFIRLTSIFHYD